MKPWTTHPEHFNWTNLKAQLLIILVHSLFFAIAIVFCLLLTSCGTSKQVTVVDSTTHDTLYINKVQYDSIYTNDSYLMDYHPSKDYIYLFDSVLVMKVDTMYIRDKQVEYKYRYLHDTTYVHRVDTIPIIQQVEIVKEVPRKQTWFDTICYISFGVCFCLLAVTLVCFVKACRK